MNARTLFLFMFLAFLQPGSAWGESATDDARRIAVESKVALVIGNAQYADAVPLKNPGNDAADMCAALKQLGFEVVCKINIGTKREFKDAIYEFTGKVNQNTVALFYFAGHGVQVDGVNYLIPVKAALRTRSDIEDESVQLNYLMSELEARQAALNLFFLDACRDNPFSNPIRGYVPMLGLASQLYAPRNSIVAMSTGAGQLSLDGDGRNGTFTKNLLQYLATPRLSIEDMLKTVSSGTRADAARLNRQQDPQVTTSFTDKFCLAGCAHMATAASEEQLRRTAELTRLQTTIAETRIKQAELDAQQALLSKKRVELDALRQGLEGVESKQEELQRRQAEVARREQELQKIAAEMQASADKVRELEAVRLSLLKKQEEVEQIRASLARQQASVDAGKQELATRALKPRQKKAPPVTLVPAF